MNFIKGDLLQMVMEGKFDIIAHGCNCQNVMGAGIAKQIADKFPDAFLMDKFYRGEHHNEPYDMMGNYSEFWYYDQDKNLSFHILNLYTQLYPGTPSPHSNIPFDYEAFALCLRKINYRFRTQNLRIGLPYIGCGLARADKEMVIAIIEAELKYLDVTLVEYEDNQISQRSMAPAGLGNVIPNRKKFDNGRETERRRYPMGGNNG